MTEPTPRQVEIAGRSFGGSDFGLIAGPCSIESEELCLRVAEHLATLADKLGIPVIFKASYDKANRTSIDSWRGPGLDDGLSILERVRDASGLPVLSDIHTPAQAAPAAEVLDVLQIPAFLCRQTDLIAAAAETGKPVNLKKGQFLAPWDMKHVVEKAERSGAEAILVTERGTSFGYNNLVTDFRAIPVLARSGWPVIFDGTHSVQLPGGAGDASGGQREMVPVLCRAASATGVDGFFLETHPDPDSAKSDGANMLPLDSMEELISRCLDIRSAAGF